LAQAQAPCRQFVQFAEEFWVPALILLQLFGRVADLSPANTRRLRDDADPCNIKAAGPHQHGMTGFMIGGDYGFISYHEFPRAMSTPQRSDIATLSQSAHYLVLNNV
jgi:hypothetical protein